MRKQKKISDPNYPPFYPNGWYGVHFSNQLITGQVKAFVALQHNLLIFRDECGKIYVTEKLCSHDDYECNPRCFKFSSNSSTIDITYDYNSVVKAWPVIEQDNIIYIWHHSESKKPDYYPNKLDSKYVYSASAKTHLYAFMQDILENSADTSHFKVVHRPMFNLSNVYFRNFLEKYFYYLNDLEWKVTEKHFMIWYKISMSPIVFGKQLFKTEFTTESQNFLSANSFNLFGIKGQFIVFVIPLYLDRVKMFFVAYSDTSIKSKIMSIFLAHIFDKLVNDDVIIWNNKKFVKNPIYTKNDKNIIEFRKWVQQFY